MLIQMMKCMYQVHVLGQFSIQSFIPVVWFFLQIQHLILRLDVNRITPSLYLETACAIIVQGHKVIHRSI